MPKKVPADDGKAKKPPSTGSGQAPAPEPASVPASKAAQAKKILIVEDERPLAHALELKMSHEGYDVTVALTGVDGLAKAESGNFDLILTDLIMPQMDGFALMQELKTKGIKSGVIVLSNLGQEEDRKRALEMGAKDYFVKANTPIAEIVKKVKSVL
jgi:DNA-binding response OmpR family regulator